MCYSAQIAKDYRKHLREHGGEIDYDAFARFYGTAGAERLRRPKAMDMMFRDPQTSRDQAILDQIKQLDRDQLIVWQDELERQRQRLTAAEAVLSGGKPTKKAENDQRIANEKIRRLTRSIQALQRPTLSDANARIYPMWFAPVLIVTGGRLVMRPMRYHCRPSGKPASYDRRYPGLYNARRDNLQRFWKGQFGHTHGVLLASAFYENVSRHDLERSPLREGEAAENVVLEFRPSDQSLMHVACLWSTWTAGAGEQLESFAAITDEPPPEVAAAGHDRCIIPIDPTQLRHWLEPDADLDRAYATLDSRERPYYDHRAAA